MSVFERVPPRSEWPFRLGQRVTIREVEEPHMDPKYIGETGVIVERKVDHLIGESERDPLWSVHVKGVGRDVFWTEELAPVDAPKQNKKPFGPGPGP